MNMGSIKSSDFSRQVLQNLAFIITNFIIIYSKYLIICIAQLLNIAKLITIK